MAQPIQAVQIYFEHPFGAEREVLREFFSFVGCLVKTTMMPVETMLEKHKSLVNPESERITHLFLTDRPPEGIVLSKNEMWCSFRILKRELTINGKAILRNADQKISAEQFEKAALDVIIRRIWKDDKSNSKPLAYQRFFLAARPVCVPTNQKHIPSTQDGRIDGSSHERPILFAGSCLS